MGNDQQPELVDIEGWKFRIKTPLTHHEKPRILLMLHGHLGNENVMWILTKPIPQDYVIMAPRAPLKQGEKQYSWHEIQPQWPDINYYEGLICKLLSRVEFWLDQNKYKTSEINVMGFSQGAVMAYALAMLHPQKTGQIAAIGGLIPQTWQAFVSQTQLHGKQFFIAHGTRDNIVPILKASKAAEWLRNQGAEVTFCKADIGHKLSANCFNGLGDFFN